MAKEKKDRIYVEDRKVKEIKELDKKTPLGQDILKVSFDTGEDLVLTRKKFDVIKTHKASDATTARDRLSENIAQQIYALFMEYGLRLSEIDPVWNAVINSINAAQGQANRILWNIDLEGNKTLLMVNDVLMEKYGKEEQPETKGDDATAS